MQQQFNSMVAGIDRATLIKAVAIGLLIYAVLFACVGVFGTIGATILGGMSLGSTAIVGQTGVDTLDAEIGTAMAQATAMSGMLLVISLLALISVPVNAAAAYGLFKRKAWSRNLTIVALGLIVLSEILSLNGIFDILWLVLAAFLLYMFLTDEGIKRELAY